MSIVVLILCSLFITYVAKNREIDGNAKTVGIIIAGILGVGSMFV